MSKTAFVSMVVTLATTIVSADAPDAPFIRITSPKADQSVDTLAEVTGEVSIADAEVWLVVRPPGLAEYWVQPQAAVGRSKKFEGLANIGRPNQDYGKKFEIRAVANPKVELRVGDVLKTWPPAEASSEIVRVIKAKQPE